MDATQHDRQELPALEPGLGAVQLGAIQADEASVTVQQRATAARPEPEEGRAPDKRGHFEQGQGPDGVHVALRHAVAGEEHRHVAGQR